MGVTADGRSFLCNGDMFLKQMKLMAAGLVKYSEPSRRCMSVSSASHTSAKPVACLAWFCSCLFIIFCGSFETGFPHVAVAGLELAMWARLAWNLLKSSHLCLLPSGVSSR